MRPSLGRILTIMQRRLTTADTTLGSLFDGIGVFPLAAQRNGIVPLWASEIEKAPISITKRHFPAMRHLGDITKLHGSEVPPVHIITFGSPCQNFFLKQGGAYPSFDPFRCSECGSQQSIRSTHNSKTASDLQMTLFPLF